MAESSGELKILKDEVCGLKEDVTQIKELLEQIAKSSIKDESEKIPRIAEESPGTSQPSGKSTALPGTGSGKKTSKCEIDVLQFQQLVEDSIEIPGLLDVTEKEDWEECLKILKESLKKNSPAYREFLLVKDDVYHDYEGDLSRRLLEEEFGIYESDYTSILAEAAKYSLINLIAVFLKNKVSVNQIFGINQETMLHVAAEYGQYELVKLLLSLGAAVNAKNRGKETPLHLAAGANHPHVVEALLENGADIDAIDMRNETPWMVFDKFVQLKFSDKNTHAYAVANILKKYYNDRL